MVPPGYAAPNPYLNISINDANATVAALANFGIPTTLLEIEQLGAQSAQYVTIADAQAAGATDDDPLYIQAVLGSVQGLPAPEGPSEVATMAAIIAPGIKNQARALGCLTQLFSCLYPYQNAASLALTALGQNTSVSAAVQAQLKK
jgi:hypothetical protein